MPVEIFVAILIKTSRLNTDFIRDLYLINNKNWTKWIPSTLQTKHYSHAMIVIDRHHYSAPPYRSFIADCDRVTRDTPYTLKRHRRVITFKSKVKFECTYIHFRVLPVLLVFASPCLSRCLRQRQVSWLLCKIATSRDRHQTPQANRPKTCSPAINTLRLRECHFRFRREHPVQTNALRFERERNKEKLDKMEQSLHPKSEFAIGTHRVYYFTLALRSFHPADGFCVQIWTKRAASRLTTSSL